MNKIIPNLNWIRIFYALRTFFVYFITFNHILISSVAYGTTINHVSDTDAKSTHSYGSFKKTHLLNEDTSDNGEHEKSSSSYSRWYQNIFSPLKDVFSKKMDSLLVWSYEYLKDIAPHILAKSPQEAAFDPKFWTAHFEASIVELKNSSNSDSQGKIRLEELLDLVNDGVLSPYIYEQGLKDLSNVWPSKIIATSRTALQAALKKTPALLEKYMHKDIFTTIQQSNPNVEEFKQQLAFYREVQNPLDYKAYLQGALDWMGKNKKNLPLTKGQYQDVCSALQEGIDKSNKKQRRLHKEQRRHFLATSQTLPFFGEEIGSEGIWAGVAAIDETPSHPSLKTNPLSVITLKRIAYNTRKVLNYVSEHPLQTVVFITAAQIAGAAALKAFAPLTKESADSQLPHDGLSETQINNKRTINGPFNINNDPVGSQSNPNPQVISLPDGNFFATWISGQNLRGRFFNNTGDPLADSFSLNSLYNISTGISYSTAICQNGDVCAIWPDTTSSNTHLSIGSFNESSLPLTSEFVFAQGSARISLATPTLTSLNQDDILAGFYSYNSTAADIDIKGTYFKLNNTSLPIQFPVNKNTTGTQMYPYVLRVNATTGYYLWSSQETGDYDIRGRYIDYTGTPLTDDIPINFNRTGDQYLPFAINMGNKIFVSFTGTQEGSLNAYGTFVDINTGIPFSKETRLNQNSPLAGTLIQGFHKNNKLYLTWSDSTNTPPYDSYLRIFDENGTALIDDTCISDCSLSYKEAPSWIAPSPNGNIFAIWRRNTVGQSNYNTIGRILTADYIAGLLNPPVTTGTTAVQGTSTSTSSTTSTTGANPTTTQQGTTSQASSTTTSMTATTSTSTGATVTTGQISTVTTDAPSTTTGNLTTQQGTTAQSTSTSSSSTTLNASSTMGQTTGQLSTTATSMSPTEQSGLDQVNSSNGGLSSGAKAGIAIGVTVPVIAAASFVGYKFYKNKNSSPTDIELGSRYDNNRPSSTFDVQQGRGIEGGQFTVSGTLHNQRYGLYFKIDADEANEIKQQTGIDIKFQTGQEKVDLILGKGQFGQVRVAQDLDSKDFAAVKIVAGEEKVRASLSEGETQAALNSSENILPLLEYLHYQPLPENKKTISKLLKKTFGTTTINDQDMTLQPLLLQFTPLATLGSGEDFQRKLAMVTDNTLRDKLLRHVTKSLLSGLTYMHKAGYYHFDLKPSNILMTREGKIYVSDFGCTEKVDGKQFAGGNGDIRYYSPERIAHRRYIHKAHNQYYGLNEVAETFSPEAADTWALAITLLEMASNNYPLERANVHTILTSWSKEHMAKMVNDIPLLQEERPFTTLMKSMLSINPKNAILIPQALNQVETWGVTSQQAAGELFKQLIAIEVKPVHSSTNHSGLSTQMSMPTTKQNTAMEFYNLDDKNDESQYYHQDKGSSIYQ